MARSSRYAQQLDIDLPSQELRRSKAAKSAPGNVIVNLLGRSPKNADGKAMSCGHRFARSPRHSITIPRDLWVARYLDRQFGSFPDRQTYWVSGVVRLAAQRDPVLVCGLDALLKERGITGSQLALEARVTEATVSKLRRNAFVSIAAEPFARICRYLKVQPGDLLSVQ